jgi:hypothetical protein
MRGALERHTETASRLAEREMRREQIGRKQALTSLENRDRERRDFVLKDFHKDVTDPHFYDLVQWSNNSRCAWLWKNSIPPNADRWSINRMAVG